MLPAPQQDQGARDAADRGAVVDQDAIHVPIHGRAQRRRLHGRAGAVQAVELFVVVIGGVRAGRGVGAVEQLHGVLGVRVVHGPAGGGEHDLAIEIGLGIVTVGRKSQRSNLFRRVADIRHEAAELLEHLPFCDAGGEAVLQHGQIARMPTRMAQQFARGIQVAHDG